jgi:tight adherence protein B
MTSKLEKFIKSLGWERLTPAAFCLLVISASGSIFLFIIELTGSPMIAGSIVACLSVQVTDSLRTKSRNLALKNNSDWPKFLDAVSAAAWAGVGLEQALMDSSAFAPDGIRWAMVELEKDLVSNLGLDNALVNFKSRLQDPIADRFAELTRLASQAGGRGYLAALRAQSIQLRLENATWAEVTSKQNWVISSAKLAVLAPWIILLLLAGRRETAEAFNSQTGFTVLAIGLVASLLAFQLVRYLATFPKRQRVLAG